MTRARQNKFTPSLPFVILGVSFASLIGSILCFILLWSPHAETTTFMVRNSGTVITVPRYDADGFPATPETAEPTVGADLDELDYWALVFVAHNLLLLYAYVLVICIVIVCCKRNMAGSEPALTQVARHVLPATVAIATSAYFAFSLSFFGEYYPTRWSDFSAWNMAMHTVSENLTVVLSADPTFVDSRFVVLWYTTLAFGAAAVAFLVIATIVFLFRNTQKRPSHALK